MAFSPAQIVRIKCENILTYQSIEIFPCPKLNLIIGANGTGKSTIISAIILGLGGNAGVVGRAQDLKQYVKVGQKQASIEIELFNPEGEGNVTIERHFNVRGESRFVYNGRNITLEKLERIVRRFHIQIDNLCQILPQEKLESFAKMNDHERLCGTLKTVGDNELYCNLELLKNSKDQEKDIHRKLALWRDELVEAKSKRDTMEIEVRTIKEREFLMECFKLVKQRREWQLYFHLKQALNMIDDSMKSRQAACKKLMNILKSTKADVVESSSRKKNAEEVTNEASKKVNSVIVDIKKRQNDITSAIDKVTDVKSALKQKEVRFKSQENDEKLLREKIEKDKAEIIDVSQVDCKLGLLRSELQNREYENRQVEVSKETVGYAMEEKNNERAALASKLKKLNDVNAQKMQILEQYYEDCAKGVKWLDKNKHLFKGEVYGPMFLYLNVNDMQCAKYVEASINQRDLIAFICELREDTTTLIKELREKMKYKVSIVSAKHDIRPEQLQPPYPIEELQHLGFHSYVSDMISGPAIIVQYLTWESRLHRIPIGNAHTYAVSHQVPSDITIFFTDKYRFQVKVVAYTGEKIESSREVMPPRYLASNSNSMSAMDGVQEQYENCVRELQRLSEEYQKHEAKVTAGDNDIRLKRNEIKKLESQKLTQSRRKEIIQSRERELRALQSKKIDLDTERTRSNLEVKLLLAQVTNKYIELCSAFKMLFEAFINYQQEKINADQFEKIHSKNLSTTMDFLKKLASEASGLRELGKKKRRLMKTTKNCYKHAMKCTNRIDPRSPEFKQRNMFFKLTDDIVVLDRLLSTFQAKVNCLGDENRGMEIFKDYKALIKEVKKKESKIADKERILQEHFAKIDQTKERFLMEVTQLIATIDNNFRKFFEMMGCVGTVCLYEGEQGDDFKQYGIHIKVKFRREGELRILNSQVQSGGERAVSIAIYLLSLQELTSVPFRCIDEINQGMDADNERRIFNLITESTEERGNTQYFLLTPKLLPNLNFTPNCKIFFPYNGIGSMSHQRYSQLVERRRASQGTAAPSCSSSFSES